MEIREAMEKASETLETTSSTPVPDAVETTATAPVETVTTETPVETRTAAERARDERGRFAPKPGDVPAKESAAAPKGDANGAAKAAPPADQGKGDGAATSPAPPPEPASEPKVEPLRAPQSLKPAAREKWAAVPREVQEDIVRREKETSQALQQAAEDRKAWQTFQQVVQPYESMIRASGATHPIQVVQNLLATANVLRAGTPAEKAQMGARIIRDFGIDVEALAAALDGQPVKGQAAPQVDPAAIAQQAEQRIMERLRAESAQRQAERFRTTLETFAQSHEFFDDVREQMADILVARGIKAPTDQQLAEVYDLACRVNPEVAPVMRQREAAKSAPTAQAATARVQAAASSVKSSPAAAPNRTAQPKSIREAMEAADQQLSGRL